MKGKGTTVWSKAQSAVSRYPLDIPQSEDAFFRNLCAFMVFRYYLGGLSSGIFTLRWLLQENTPIFYKNLASSDFFLFEKVFTIKGFSKYEKYMKYSLC